MLTECIGWHVQDTDPDTAVQRGVVLLAYLDTEWKRIQQALRQPAKQLGKMLSKVCGRPAYLRSP